MGRLTFLVFFIFFNFIFCYSQTLIRNLTTQVLSDSQSNSTHLVHTQARGESDDLHFIYTNLRKPSILIAKTTKESQLIVDWIRFLDKVSVNQQGSIWFNKGNVLNSAFFSIEQFFVFNDSQSFSNLTLSEPQVKPINISALNWNLKVDKNSVYFISLTPGFNGTTQNITIRFLGSSGLRSSTPDLPHLLLNSNLTQIDIFFKDIDYRFNETFKNPRIAMEMLLLTTDKFHKSVLLTETSLNDEISPGAFRTITWFSQNNQSKLKGEEKDDVFLQWKPISYNRPIKSIQSVAMVTTYPIENNYSATQPSQLLFCSLATGFYNNHLIDNNMELSLMNVSFGSAGQFFYSKTNFTSWKFTFGLGKREDSKISLLIILMISLGVGIPIFFLLLLCLYLLIKSSRGRFSRRGYEELSNSYPRIT